MTNPLSPAYFMDRVFESQREEGRRREAFGGGEEPLTTFTDADGETFEGEPDVAPLCCEPGCDECGESRTCEACRADCSCVQETVEFRGAQIEVIDPSEPDERAKEILAEIAAIRRLNARVTTETFEDVAQEVMDEAFNLLVARQKKYGPRNIEDQGPLGVLQRIEKDKLNRIKRAFHGSVVKGEIVLDKIDMGGEEGDTLEDALLDVANYALIILLLLRGKWGRPLQADVEAAA